MYFNRNVFWVFFNLCVYILVYGHLIWVRTFFQTSKFAPSLEPAPPSSLIQFSSFHYFQFHKPILGWNNTKGCIDTIKWTAFHCLCKVCDQVAAWIMNSLNNYPVKILKSFYEDPLAADCPEVLYDPYMTPTFDSFTILFAYLLLALSVYCCRYYWFVLLEVETINLTGQQFQQAPLSVTVMLLFLDSAVPCLLPCLCPSMATIWTSSRFS